MAAPQIPHLTTLCGAGRSRGRGRGRGNVSTIPTSAEEKSLRDKIVQQTDQDASISRLSAVKLGYMTDPFAKLFASMDAQTRFPIINRGTYIRTRSIDSLVDQFISGTHSTKKQIISLGAGSDTRYFRLLSQDPKLRTTLLYHELDFSANTAQKVSTIHNSPDLRHLLDVQLPEPTSAQERLPDYLNGNGYYIHAIDLRDLDPEKPLPRTFDHIDRETPSLILSECCLIYLDPGLADKAAKYFTKFLFPPEVPLGIILYEPIKPSDSFGKVMVSNLAARGIELRTLMKYGTMEAQAARMRSYGFDGSRGMDVNELWQTGADDEEKSRVASLEMMDEVEEWELLAAHYCVVWAWRGHSPWSDPAPSA